jgi:hypothetical protein
MGMKGNGMKIKINCKGADVLSIEQLEEFQGELKDLSKEDYGRLKGLIEKHGFCAPIFVWKHGDTNKILDGHQRLRTVKQMKDEGWECDKLPVDWIYADTEQAAKEILMGFVSQFGSVTGQGLYQFMFDTNISLETLKSDYRLPDVNVENFAIEFFNEFPLNAQGKEFDESAADDVKMVECPKCGEKFPA